MIRLAFRNLFQNKARLAISIGGVALALLLILSLDAVFTGVERQVTAYIENSGADEERLSAGDPSRIATNVESRYLRIGTKKSCGNPCRVEIPFGRLLCSIVFRSESK